jgi:hypothetical protein
MAMVQKIRELMMGRRRRRRRRRSLSRTDQRWKYWPSNQLER